MKIGFKSNGEQLTLGIEIFTRQPEKMRICVQDATKPYTKFTDRESTVNGRQKFFIRMPLTPKNANILIYNLQKGNHPKGVDKSFRVVNLKILPLKKKLTEFYKSKPNVISFVKFAQEFSINAGILSAGRSVYLSDDNQFHIEYLDVIRNRKTGWELTTPARIDAQCGKIQISKKYFQQYTVPMRMIILLHEFSHFYLNKDNANETEADLNALLIYLGLGFPRIEAYECFFKIFKNAATDGNVDRYKMINKFITDFEKNDIHQLNYY